MKITARNVQFAWKYRNLLWKYRKLIRYRHEIAAIAATGAVVVAGVFLKRSYR
jgi:hypothetical protein